MGENDPSGVNATRQYRRLGGITGKGFMPGQSGNPSGKNRSGLAALVRSRTKNGEVLVERMYRIACGARFKTSRRTPGTVLEVRERPSISDRIEAIKWLSDRGWGKARDIVHVDGEEARRPFLIVMRGPLRDPLEEEAVPVDSPGRKPPALPTQMPEIGFELNLEDLEE
jgi:hypothetical protein